MPYIERPNFFYDELQETAGYVTRVWVEQEDDRDQIKFTLEVYMEAWGDGTSTAWVYELSFNINLDVGTTVALAQLQLLRDAMANQWLVRVHYSLWEDGHDSGTVQTAMHGYAYWLRATANAPYPTTAQDAIDLDF